jgi:hypothetical protein
MVNPVAAEPRQTTAAQLFLKQARRGVTAAIFCVESELGALTAGTAPKNFCI